MLTYADVLTGSGHSLFGGEDRYVVRGSDPLYYGHGMPPVCRRRCGGAAGAGLVLVSSIEV